LTSNVNLLILPNTNNANLLWESCVPKELLGEFEHHVLLTVLRIGEESYSVPIVTELEERTDREVAAAAVYIALRRLEAKGLAESELRAAAPDQTGRSRRYFRVTEAGTQLLRESRRRFDRLWEGLDPVIG